MLREAEREAVSIRASRAGGDQVLHDRREATGMFQSAPPAREATPRPADRAPMQPVSIRASRAGGDAVDWSGHIRTKVSIRASRAGGDMVY